jgi:hypothetical protein
VRAEHAGPAENGEKVRLDFAERFSNDGRPGDQHKVKGLRHGMLVESKNLPQHPARAIPFDGIADVPAGDDANAGGRAGEHGLPIGHHAALGHSFALRFDSCKITSLFDAPVLGQPERKRGRPGHGLAGRSNRCQSFASFAAPIGEDGASAFAGVAIEKAVLPLAAGFGRLICSFHV